MLDIKISKNIDNERVLVTETNINRKQHPNRYYVVPQENADAFIDGKKSLDNVDKIQKGGSVILGGLAGLAVYKSVFHKKPIKAIASIITGLATIAGALIINKKIDNQAQKNIFDKTGSYEITDNQEKLSKILSTQTEPTEEIKKDEQ